MTAPELTCQELVELVTDYLEGALPEHDRARLEVHLDMCEGCRRYLEQYRQTIATVGRLSEDDVSPEALEDLRAAFRTWRRSPG